MWGKFFVQFSVLMTHHNKNVSFMILEYQVVASG